MFDLFEKTVGQKVNDSIGILFVGFCIFIIIMLVMKQVHETVKCPHCMSGISKSAKVCKHCGRDV